MNLGVGVTFKNRELMKFSEVWEKFPTIGVDTQIHRFDFLFVICPGKLLLRHTDNLNKSDQKKSLSAAEGQRLACLTLDVLKLLHDEDNFKQFYKRVLQDKVIFQIDDPTLPRKRRTTRHLLISATRGDYQPILRSISSGI